MGALLGALAVLLSFNRVRDPANAATALPLRISFVRAGEAVAGVNVNHHVLLVSHFNHTPQDHFSNALILQHEKCGGEGGI